MSEHARKEGAQVLEMMSREHHSKRVHAAPHRGIRGAMFALKNRWSTALLLGLLACAPAAGIRAGSEPKPSKPVAAGPTATEVAAAIPAAFPHKRAVTAESPRGMVVTDAKLATDVGARVLGAGGNAADAAVATAFALAVVFPTAGNLGGGGFAVARMGGQEKASTSADLWALDFRETASELATPTMYGENAGGFAAPSRLGHRAAGVPGSVAGLVALHQKLGSMKWSELVAPSVRLAEEGFVVDEDFAKSISSVAERLAKFPASAKLFLPDGAPPKVGSTFKNPDLAAVLKRIQEFGHKGFYEGATADLLLKEMARGNAPMTAGDLRRYEAKWRAPMSFSYRGHRVVSMPPPSSGGLTLAMMAAILEPYPLPTLPWRSPREIHLMAEASRRAFFARNARLGDPDFVKNPIEELRSKAWADAQRATISETKSTPSESLGMREKASGGAGPHTTHFSVVDGKGGVVALTTTVNWWFGNAVTVEGAGFVLNNEMDDFAVIPGTANTFGLVQGEPNAIAPGKRMLSSMAPTLVFEPDGQLKLVLGGAGGPTIISAVMQVMTSVVDHNVDIAFAEAAPRFHHQGLPDLLTIEKDGLSAESRAALLSLGHQFKERDHIADAPSIAWNGRAWVGAAEPRRNGALALAPRP